MSQTLGLLDLGNFMQFLFVHKDYSLNVTNFFKTSALLIVEETDNTPKHHAKSDRI